MLRWSVELSEYDINCKPWPMLKGQVVVDFIARKKFKKTSKQTKTMIQPKNLKFG